jgi:hypothetical protein
MPGESKRSGYRDGSASQVLLNQPNGATVDKHGNFYFVDSNTVRRLSPDGVMTTIAGGQKMYFQTPSLFPDEEDLAKMFSHGSSRDGMGRDAHFAGPVSVAVDASGRLLVGQKTLPAIRQVDASGQVTTIIGPGKDLCRIAKFPEEGAGVSSVLFLNDGRIAFTAANYVFVQKAGALLRPHR